MKKALHFSAILFGVPSSILASSAEAAQNGLIESMSNMIFGIGIIIILGRAGNFLFEKIKIPSVLGELVLGIIIGPYLLGTVPLPGFPEGLFPLSLEGSIPVSSHLYAIATIASIILLFVSGLETDIGLLLRYSLAGTLVGIGGVIFSFFSGAAIGYLFLHRPFFDPLNLFLGVISTATSVGITARILSERRKMDSAEGVTILAGAVIDDVLGIILLAIITSVAAATRGSGAVELQSVEIIAIRALAVWLGFTIAGLTLAKYLNRFLKLFKSNIAISVFAIGMAFMLAGFFEKAGLAMIIGAYIMGLTLSKTDLNYSIHEAISPLYTFFVPIFFVVMGMLVDIRVLLDPRIFLFGCLYAAVAIAAKIIGCGFPSLFLNFNKLGALRIGMGMVPRGEVALIIAGIGLSSRVIDDTVFGASIIMTLITTLIAPPLLNFLLQRGNGVRKEIKKRTTVTTSFDFTTPELTDLLNVRIMQYFFSEGFYVHSMKIDQKTIHEIRKETIVISATTLPDSIIFETDQQDVMFVKTIVYEALLQLNTTIEKVREFIHPETIQRELTEVSARPGIDIAKLLNQKCIIPDLKARNKNDIIEEMVTVLYKNKLIINKDDALRAVLERESTMSTGMQHGVAIPHGKSDAVSGIVVAVGLAKQGVDFQSLDGEPSRIFVMVISPLMTSGPHIQFLASLSALLNNEDFRNRLLQSRSRDEIMNAFKQGLS